MELKELAARAKISIGFLADIESGRGKPSIKTLKKLANALDTSPNYLLNGKDEFKAIDPEAIKEFKKLNEELTKISDKIAEWMEKYMVNNGE